MNTFDYHYPVRQHFGKGCAGEAIRSEMKSVGTRVLLAPQLFNSFRAFQ